MIIIRKIIFALCGAFILMSSKCAQTKVILEDSPEIKVVNAYTQKMVPGEKSKKPYIEFGFEVKGVTNNVIIDSIFCEVGKAINIKTDGKNRIKLLVEGSLIDELKYSSAIFYYSNQGSKYEFELTKIKKEETLFLP
jgi:hypothetical protein